MTLANSLSLGRKSAALAARRMDAYLPVFMESTQATALHLDPADLTSSELEDISTVEECLIRRPGWL
jgi:hypothetical protein